MKHFTDENRNVDSLEIRAVLSAIDHQLANDLRTTNGSCPDPLKLFANRRSLLAVRQGQFARSQDAAQQIIEIMGDSVGQNTYAFQFLNSQRLLLGVLH